MSDSIDGGPPQDGKRPNKWADLGLDMLCEAPRRYILLKRKRILVTGADGFIGSRLTGTLGGKGAGVFALCQYNSFNRSAWLENLLCISRLAAVAGAIGREPCASLAGGLRRMILAYVTPPFGVQEPASG